MQADTAQRRLLTVREAASELHVSRDWVYQSVPVVRLGEGQGRGQVVRVRPEDLERLRGDGR
jgi:hypothetical protein